MSSTQYGPPAHITSAGYTEVYRADLLNSPPVCEGLKSCTCMSLCSQ